MTKVNTGLDTISNAVGNVGVGASLTASSPTSTGFTTSGIVASALVGCMVVAGSVYGVVTANTTTTVTVDRWYNFATPGGAAGTTPSAGTFFVVPGNAPAGFMALTANTTAPAAGDTVLTGEITTAGGGLVRKLAAYAHTSGASTYTLSATFTGNGSDVYSVIIHKIGIFNTFTPATGQMTYETVISADATLSASGDQVTITDTVTIS